MTGKKQHPSMKAFIIMCSTRGVFRIYILFLEKENCQRKERMCLFIRIKIVVTSRRLALLASHNVLSGA